MTTLHDGGITRGWLGGGGRGFERVGAANGTSTAVVMAPAPSLHRSTS